MPPPPEQPPNLLTAFAALAGKDNPEMAEQAEIVAEAIAPRALRTAAPPAAPTKAELVESLKAKTERLRAIQSERDSGGVAVEKESQV
jgi:hypothetical protein